MLQCSYLSGYVSMVPAMAPDVSRAQFQLLLQFLAKFLRRRLQQVLLLGELFETNKRRKQDISMGLICARNSSQVAEQCVCLEIDKNNLYITYLFR